MHEIINQNPRYIPENKGYNGNLPAYNYLLSKQQQEQLQTEYNKIGVSAQQSEKSNININNMNYMDKINKILQFTKKNSN